MEEVRIVLVLLAAVVVSGALARASRVALPLVQIALGVGIAMSPVPAIKLNPELFFVLFLPPLLFLDGWRIPKRDLFRDRRVVLELALGLVVLTVLGLGFLLHWLIPAMPLPVAFALAAIVSPTDPIAVSAVASRAPIPHRMMHILEGEALLNDASGLVCMRFAVAAMLTGAFSVIDAVATFLVVAAGGVFVGVATVWLLMRVSQWASRRLGEDTGASILLSLIIPFVAYLIAEHFHGSGILAAAAAGITMSFTEGSSHALAVTRVRRAAVWDMIQFAANGAIFVLLGEQLPAVLGQAGQTVLLTGHGNPWWLGFYVLAAVAALVALRFVWVGTSLRMTWFRARLRQPGGGEAPRKVNVLLVVAVSLAGVRGAVTLAGILTLPLLLDDGRPFPARDLAIFLATGVILVTLLIATFALPPLLRRLDLPPEPNEQTAIDDVQIEASRMAIDDIRRVQRAVVEGRPDTQTELQADAAKRVMALYEARIEGRLVKRETDADRQLIERFERELRLSALRAERATLESALRDGRLSEAAFKGLLRDVDVLVAKYSD